MNPPIGADTSGVDASRPMNGLPPPISMSRLTTAHLRVVKRVMGDFRSARSAGYLILSVPQRDSDEPNAIRFQKENAIRFLLRSRLQRRVAKSGRREAKIEEFHFQTKGTAKREIIALLGVLVTV